MNQKQLRGVIVVLGIATGLIHLYLNVRLGRLDIPFTANGLGYLALSAAMAGLVPASLLAGRERLLHYIFMAFTVVTIVGWLIMGDKSDLVGIFDKIIEVLLLIALWLRSRQIAQ